VVEHVRKAIADPGIAIHVDRGREASRTARTDTRGFRLVERSLRKVYPDAVVAPALIIGGTDAKHMAALTDDIYRNSPVRARSEDIPRNHGVDERISIANYVELINVYVRLLADANTVPAVARR
jgi:carboxypeptidase PM20D1